MGIIIVFKASHVAKADADITTREVGKTTLTSLLLSTKKTILKINKYSNATSYPVLSSHTYAQVITVLTVKCILSEECYRPEKNRKMYGGTRND